MIRLSLLNTLLQEQKGSLGPFFFFFFLSRCQGANTLELSGLNGIVQSLKPLQIRLVGSSVAGQDALAAAEIALVSFPLLNSLSDQLGQLCP